MRYADVRNCPPAERQAEAKALASLPSDMLVISTDSHWSVGDDIWHERFPAHLKDKAPRVWRENGFCNMGFNGKTLYPDRHMKVLPLFEGRPGSSDLQSRLADMEAEGVDKEIAFPSGVLLFMHHPDLEVREWVFRIYNEHLAEVQEASGGRFYGVGLLNYWDLSKTQASLDELKALGLKTFLLPIAPKNDAEGNQIFYAADKMETLWGAIEDSGLPISFHIGETASPNVRNENFISALQNFSPFRKVFGEMIFGGILDRHPKLQMAFVEAGINWVASALQDAEVIAAGEQSIAEWDQQLSIQDYWRKHMFATFMTDPIGLRLLDIIGTDRIMWSSDYPHAESTVGFTRSSIQDVFDVVSEEEGRMIVGGTARKLFNL